MVRFDVDENIADIMLSDPYLLLEGAKPRLLDEWQEQPKIRTFHTNRLCQSR
jgi:hypothetical protein